MKNQYTPEDFRKALRGKLRDIFNSDPSLNDLSDEELVGPYHNTRTLAEIVNSCLKKGDNETLQRALELAKEYYLNGDPSLQSAFEHDFFEVLELRTPAGRKLFNAFCKRFKQAYLNAQNYIGKPY